MLKRNFRIYLLPCFIGILIFIFYSILSNFYNINKKEFVGIIIIIVIIVVEIINSQINSRSNISFIDKVFNYLYNSGETLNKNKEFNINRYIDIESFIVSRSRSNLWITLLGIILIFGFSIFFFLRNSLYSFTLILSYILIRSVYNIFKELNNNSPKLVIKKEGIAISQFGFFKWEDIKLIEFRDTSSNETNNTNLDIFLSEKEKWRRPDFSITVDGLDKTEDEIKEAIKKSRI